MKATESDRFDRADKLRKEASAQQRKNLNSNDFPDKKKGKPKSGNGLANKNWSREYEYPEDEYDFV